MTDVSQFWRGDMEERGLALRTLAERMNEDRVRDGQPVFLREEVEEILPLFDPRLDMPKNGFAAAKGWAASCVLHAGLAAGGISFDVIRGILRSQSERWHQQYCDLDRDDPHNAVAAIELRAKVQAVSDLLEAIEGGFRPE